MSKPQMQNSWQSLWTAAMVYDRNSEVHGACTQSRTVMVVTLVVSIGSWLQTAEYRHAALEIWYIYIYTKPASWKWVSVLSDGSHSHSMILEVGFMHHQKYNGAHENRYISWRSDEYLHSLEISRFMRRIPFSLNIAVTLIDESR